MKKSKPTPEPAPSMTQPHLLTIPEAGQYLRFHPRTVKALLKRGELRGHLISRRWRILSEDLDRFVQEAPTQWEFMGRGENQK